MCLTKSLLLIFIYSFHFLNFPKQKHIYIYCELCQKGWKENVPGTHPDHSGDSIEFPGIILLRNFISVSEEEFLVNEIDKRAFVDSQSGRKKQVSKGSKLC